MFQYEDNFARDYALIGRVLKKFCLIKLRAYNNLKFSFAGATHEQNREDRDEYVKIVEDDILKKAMTNFEKKGALFSSYSTPYEYDSIMHYDENAFSVSGNKTIIPLQDGVTLM